MVKGYTLSQIIEIVRAANYKAAKCISTIRKPQSGDILLIITTVEVREELKRKGLRTNTLASFAMVL